MLHPRLAALLLLVLVVVASMVDTGVAAVVEGSTGSHHHHPRLLDCGPAPTPTSRNGDAAFRTNLSSALNALPSAAASAPHAFATVHAGCAFARGACYRANTSSPAAARACDACLSAAARDVTGGCGATTSVRAGVWRDECFLSYADSDASTSLGEDAFRGWFYAGPATPAALAGGYCLLHSADDCDRCFRDSARAAAALGWLQRIRGDEVLVVSYSCFRRIRISLLPQGPENGGPRAAAFVIWMDIVVDSAALMLVLVFVRIVKIVRALPQVNG